MSLISASNKPVTGARGGDFIIGPFEPGRSPPANSSWLRRRAGNHGVARRREGGGHIRVSQSAKSNESEAGATETTLEGYRLLLWQCRLHRGETAGLMVMAQHQVEGALNRRRPVKQGQTTLEP